MAALRIELVGGVRVRARDGREVPVTARKCRALLGCLALRPGMSSSRDFLATLLWEDADPELARSSLRQALSALRRALPDDCAHALRADTQSVWLDVDAVTSDVAEFYAQVRDGSPGALLATIEHCGEELLAGLDARSMSFERWAQEQRRSFRRTVVDTLTRIAARCGAADDRVGQLRALEQLVALEPLNESAHRDLMALLARVGRHTDALRQYRLCREALRRDLDVATDPATDDLRRDILRQRRAIDPAAAPPADEDDAGVPQQAPRAMPTLREAVVLCVRDGGASTTRDASDPERERQRWTALETRVRTVAGRFGGHVDRIGEGEVLVVFGLAALAGNESDRAVRTAWELTAEPSTALRASEGAVACGIAAGQILPAAVEAPFPLSGRPVAEARDIARASPPGATFVSPEVAGRLHGDIELQASEDDAARTTLRVASIAGRAASATPHRFVGRRAELALLTTLLAEIAASRRARTVLIRGEPGIGKSAIAAELARAATRQGIGSRTLQVLDFGQVAVERPLPALALGLLAAGTDASTDDRAAVVTEATARGLIAPEEALFASDLVDAVIPDEGRSRLAAMDSHSRERGRASLLHRMLQQAAEQPLLLVIEDVHWASAHEIAQLAELAASAAACPLLVCLTSRPGDDVLAAAWRARGSGSPLTTLDLGPLAEDEARDLASSQTGLPAASVERCIATAHGHPLYLEQLLRAAHSGQPALPGSVRGLVLARIERLAPAVQHAVHAAATLGIRFSQDALRHVLADPNYCAGTLEQAGLIAVEGDDCRFAHALIRDAVYESLLGSTRREFHRRAASWCEGRDSGLLAEHLAAADDTGAAAAYVRAATENLHAYRLERALIYAERAVECARQPQDSGDSQATLGDVHLVAGRPSEAIDAFRSSIDLATTRAARARAWLGLATSLRIVDRHDEALASLARAEQEVDPSDTRRLANLWTLRGNLHFPRGELDLCLAAHERALGFATAAGSVEEIARARGGLGDAHYQRGRLRSAHAEFRDCVTLSERHGLKGLQLSYLPMLAVTQTYTGPLEVALATCTRAAAEARKLGDRRAQVLALASKAAVELYRARYAESLESSTQGLALACELGARRFEAETLGLRGLAQLALREPTQALAALESAADTAREVCPTYCGPFAYAALALVLDDEVRIRALLQEGEDLLARGCVSHNYLEFYHLGIEVALGIGDTSRVLRYAAQLEAYTRDEPVAWADVVVARGRALAAAASAVPAAGEMLRDALVATHDMQWDAMLPELLLATSSRAG